MRSTLLSFIAALTTIVAPMVAHAQSDAVIVYGSAKPHERQVVTTAVARTVRQASWRVMNAPFTPKEIQAIVTCLSLDRPWPCVAPIASTKQIGRLIVIQVDPDGPSVVVVGQILVQSTAVPSLERRFCDPCSDQTLDQSAQELASVLLERTIARAGTTAIAIRTVPQGASIMIDGISAVISDSTIAVSAGVHQVQIQRSGYRPHSEQITVTEGQTATLAVKLVPANPVALNEDPPSLLLPIFVGGAGAAALIGSSVYSFTRDPQHTTKDQPRYLYSGTGLAIASAGGLTMGVGLYFWLRHPQTRSAPIVSYAPHGGVIGWTTRF